MPSALFPMVVSIPSASLRTSLIERRLSRELLKGVKNPIDLVGLGLRDTSCEVYPLRSEGFYYLYDKLRKLLKLAHRVNLNLTSIMGYVRMPDGVVPNNEAARGP